MSQKRFSREGFKPLQNMGGPNQQSNSNDVTIDIPLTQVTSRTGARKPDMLSPGGYQPNAEIGQESPNEKSGLFHRGPGGRRRKIEERGREANDPEDGTINAMGRFYYKFVHFSVVTRYFVYVFPVALLLAVPIIVGATAAPNAKIASVPINWFFTWFEVIWLGLWVSKLVAQILPPVFMFVIGIVSPGVRKYALILKALEIPLSLVGWAIVSLATFKPIMTHRAPNKHWMDIVQKILAAAGIGSLIFLAEKALMQLISVSYHQTQFSIKIKESKRNIYILGLLYDASRALFPEYSREFAHEDYIINDSLDLGKLGASKAVSMHNRSGSATPMRILHNVGRVGDAVIGKFGDIAQEVTGKQVFNPNAAHTIVIEALEKTSSTEALARRIWMSLVCEGKDALYEEDVHEVLGNDRKSEAEEAFATLDRDGNGDISMDEMILTVCEFARERKSIAKSMHDVDQAISVLDNLLVIIAAIVIIFIFVAFLNKSFTTTLATAGTTLLSLSFIFSATCQEVLGSCIFLFVKHPFDVGDRVDVGSDPLIVERISLLYTVFRSVNDYRTKQVPNIVLNSVWVENITRSKAMREQISLSISADTSLEDIQLLKNELVKFVTDKENSRDFLPDININVLAMTDLSKLELQVDLVHKSNWSNEMVRASRRSKFMCAMVLALRKVPIFGPGGGAAGLGDRANPTYSVAISDSEALENKKMFEDEKEKKRMVPTVATASAISPIKSLSSPLATRAAGVDYLGQYDHKGNSAASEATVLNTLNARPAAYDPTRDNAPDYNRQETAAASAVNNDITPSTTPDERRTNDVEEVRELLHQESTKGKRKGSSTGPPAVRTTSPTSVRPIREEEHAAASSSRFTPVEVPALREPVAPPPRSDSRPGTSNGRGTPTARAPVEFHEYDYAPPPLSVAQSGRQSPSGNTAYGAPGAYQSNNPYMRNVSSERGPYGVTPSRRPVGGGNNEGRSTPTSNEEA